MGYACPVCDEPQRDAEHLANHLAFQAMVHGDDHEAWLDEHAPDWAEGGPDELAPRIVEFAADAEYDVVFDDTVVGDDDGEVYDPDLQGLDEHEHSHSHGRGHTHGGGRTAVDTSSLDAEARDVVEEARELTRRMLSENASEEAKATDEADGSDGSQTDEAGDDAE